jgi:hypothetical protein
LKPETRSGRILTLYLHGSYKKSVIFILTKKENWLLEMSPTRGECTSPQPLKVNFFDEELVIFLFRRFSLFLIWVMPERMRSSSARLFCIRSWMTAFVLSDIDTALILWSHPSVFLVF